VFALSIGCLWRRFQRCTHTVALYVGKFKAKRHGLRYDWRNNLPVAQSNHVQTYEYDEDTRVLTVSFTNGAMYSYNGVSQSDADTFARSGSKGTALWSVIIPRYGKGTLLVSGGNKRR